MSSTDRDRSISSGISIPQWMKSRYDIAETFSPPNYDESFFYIRYPKSRSEVPEMQNKEAIPINKVLQSGEVADSQSFKKHTQQCQPFIHQNFSTTASEIQQTTRSQVAEDPAACGRSVLQVAQQMVANKFGSHSEELAGFDPSRRRGSRSLPSSPLATPHNSPGSKRKNPTNRYFTGPFNKAIPDNGNWYSGHWIISGILGQRDNTLTNIGEEQTTPTESTNMRRNKSLSSLLLSKNASEGSKDEDSDSSEQPSKKESNFSPKPSELREMNFWSPTSM